MVKCLECGSDCLYKAGVRYLSTGETVQRWLCRNCGYRFSEPKVKFDIAGQIFESSEATEDHTNGIIAGLDLPSKKIHDGRLFSGGKQVASHDVSTAGKGFNTLRIYNSEHQVCASDKKAKNLNTAAKIKTVAGERKTTVDKQKLKGKLLEFEFWLNKQGYDEKGCKNRAYLMKRLSNLGANLTEPETVKEVLAKQRSWNDGYKMLIVYAYESFLKMEGLSWERPKYKQLDAYPFIPTEAELDQLIAACGKKLGTFLQGLKDTGADPGELVAVQWIDINIESRTIQIRPVKGHNPRVLTLSEQFLNRLARFPKTKQRIFNIHSLKGCFYGQRKRAARKFANTRLLKISFTTFRHWKGTMEYHRTKDVLYVKKILGHKRIDNTLKYIDLEAMIFKPANDQFTVRVASNAKKACELIESGFEYITGEYNDGGKIFRKRK